MRAMKCLLKSGDTKKVLYYAGVSRNREIYVLAANYLQSLDWQNDGELMKKIVEFYLKAKAYEQLSSFYDAYAQVEIDEYRDYDKALGALKEAAKHLGKARAAPDRDHALAALQQRVFVVEQFTQARRLEKSNPEKMVQMCHALLEQPDVDSAIRVGDCFALLVECVHFICVYCLPPHARYLRRSARALALSGTTTRAASGRARTRRSRTCAGAASCCTRTSRRT